MKLTHLHGVWATGADENMEKREACFKRFCFGWPSSPSLSVSLGSMIRQFLHALLTSATKTFSYASEIAITVVPKLSKFYTQTKRNSQCACAIAALGVYELSFLVIEYSVEYAID